MIVLKFGGTSVSTKESIEAISLIVAKQKKNNPVVIVSALRSITDSLLSLSTSSTSNQIAILRKIKSTHIRLIQQLWLKEKEKNIHVSYITKVINEISSFLKTHKKISLEFQDKIVSYGEIMSSYIVCQVLLLNDIPVKQIIASEIIVTDDNFGSAEFCPILTKKKVISKLKPLINKNIIPVITGFIGSTREGKITTLGRGSSDYSASIIGDCLDSKEIQIWTDVDGIYSANPRIVKNAKILNKISYKLAEIFAESGAKILHPKTVSPAVKHKIPIRILNTFNPNFIGTIIDNDKRIEIKHLGVIHKQIVPQEILISLIGGKLNPQLWLEVVNNIMSNHGGKNLRLYKRTEFSLGFLMRVDKVEGIINDLHDKFIN